MGTSSFDSTDHKSDCGNQLISKRKLLTLKNQKSPPTTPPHGLRPPPQTCSRIMVASYKPKVTSGSRKTKALRSSICMAHARRKFVDAQGTAPEKADFFLKNVQLLYRIERKARNQQLNHEARYALRQKEALPILRELKDWLKAQLENGAITQKPFWQGRGLRLHTMGRTNGLRPRWSIGNR